MSTARAVARTLAAHGVAATVADTLEGPSTYTLVLDLAAGTRPEELDRLTRSLAVALEVDAVRVTTHTGRLALEVPRTDRQPVYLEDIALPTDAAPLVWPVGMATDGAPVLADLTRAPHVLIAGTTGSGKSTAVGAILSTLTARATPAQVQLLLIDVKRVELSTYRDSPHLAGPIATDVDAAREALTYACSVMDERYAQLETLGARSLDDVAGPVARYVVVIDELADLMLTARKSIEPLIVRLAQLGRAAGIHLVLATQRPSADVLTGLIRANVPTRLVLTTQSHTDSGIALGMSGAETLTGMGDALWLPSGSRHPIRAQVPLSTAPTPSRPAPVDPAPVDPAPVLPPPPVADLSAVPAVPAAAPQPQAPSVVGHAPDGAPMLATDRLCYLCHRHRAYPGANVCLAADCGLPTYEPLPTSPLTAAAVAQMPSRHRRRWARRTARLLRNLERTPR